MSTQVVTKTSLLSVHVAVFGPVPVSAALLPLGVCTSLSWVLDPLCMDAAPRQLHSGVLKFPWGSVHAIRHKTPELTKLYFHHFLQSPQIFF